MLHTEYEDKNSPIANLDIADALFALKDQLDRYIKGEHPFDTPISHCGDPFEWWARLDDAELVDEDGVPKVQPLAVRIPWLNTWSGG